MECVGFRPDFSSSFSSGFSSSFKTTPASIKKVRLTTNAETLLKIVSNLDMFKTSATIHPSPRSSDRVGGFCGRSCCPKNSTLLVWHWHTTQGEMTLEQKAPAACIWYHETPKQTPLACEVRGEKVNLTCPETSHFLKSSRWMWLTDALGYNYWFQFRFSLV